MHINFLPNRRCARLAFPLRALATAIQRRTLRSATRDQLSVSSPSTGSAFSITACRLKPLAAAVFFASALARPVSAIELGELNHLSYLGEPLRATVNLGQVGDTAIEDIRLKVLSEAEVQASGLQSGLISHSFSYDIQLVKRENGTAYAELRSAKPVMEPLVTLWLRMTRPSGSLHREYTLLLDLGPSSPALRANSPELAVDIGPELVVDIGPELVGNASAELVGNFDAKPIQADRRVGNRDLNLQGSVASAPANVRSPRYRVQAGDTLSRLVAGLALPAGLSAAEAMQALFDNNRGAFLRGDINQLMAGSVLDLSAFQSVESEPLANGVAIELGQQARTQPVALGDTTPRSGLAGALSLSQPVSPQWGEAGAAQGAKTPQHVIARLNSTQEMIDLLVKENTELKQRLAAIEKSDYIATLTELVAVQQAQVARLQAELMQSVPNRISGAVDAGGQNIGGGNRPSLGSNRSGIAPLPTLSQKLASHFEVFLALVVASIALLSLFLFVLLRFSFRRDAYQPYVAVNHALKADAATAAQKTSNQVGETEDDLLFGDEFIDDAPSEADSAASPIKTGSAHTPSEQAAPKVSAARIDPARDNSFDLNEAITDHTDQWREEISAEFGDLADELIDEELEFDHIPEIDDGFADIVQPKRSNIALFPSRPLNSTADQPTAGESLESAVPLDDDAAFSKAVSSMIELTQASTAIDAIAQHDLDDEANELLSMAKIYCTAGKYDQARAILVSQKDAGADPRLVAALEQIKVMERADKSGK